MKVGDFITFKDSDTLKREASYRGHYIYKIYGKSLSARHLKDIAGDTYIISKVIPYVGIAIGDGLGYYPREMFTEKKEVKW